jgi:hypothetical protein
MKKIYSIIFCATLFTALVFTSSCKKKEADPGPAGVDGANGTDGKDGAYVFPYRQDGTTLNLSGNFYSNNASFSKSFSLPFFSGLEDNMVKTQLVAGRTAGTVRTNGAGQDEDFTIFRSDSLSNATLLLNVTYDYNDQVYVNSLRFEVNTNITDSTYKKVYTTYGGGARTSGPYDPSSSLNGFELTNYGNSIAITNWNYNRNTKALSFDYAGTLTGSYNSTGNDLNFSGKVKANLKEESLRVGQN